MRKPFFLIAAGLFIAHQICQKILGIAIPVVDDYLDTLLCMPLVLTVYAAEQRRLWGRDILPLFELWGVTTALSLLFEWGFPAWSSRFTADWVDVAAYFTGTGAYIFASPSGFRFFKTWRLKNKTLH